jgi:hypothetical protein
MVGFSDPATELVEVQLVPHPAVMVIFDLGDTPIVVDDGNDLQKRDSLVAGLAPNGVKSGLASSGFRGRVRSFECLQVRLSPLVAHAVLGASSELGGWSSHWMTYGDATPYVSRSNCAV